MDEYAGLRASKKRTYKTPYKKESEVKKFIEENNIGFTYVRGYTHCDGYVVIRCGICGGEFERNMTTIRHRGIRCPLCLKRERLETEKEKAREKAEEQKQKELDKVNRSVQMEYLTKTCKECGSVYLTTNKARQYCSNECRHKFKNRLKDKRLNKTNIVDKDITLIKLADRDNNTCYLCGCAVNWDDYNIMDGLKVVGGLYPSIEHVKPLSRGGKHEWGNVRLAHKSCNEDKGTTPLIEYRCGFKEKPMGEIIRKTD